jgi:hypothetical protein
MMFIKKGGGIRPNETLATNFKPRLQRGWKTGAKSYHE